jgi:hypothetical protein
MIVKESAGLDTIKAQARRSIKKLEGDRCEVVKIELLEKGVFDTPRGKYKGQKLLVYYRKVTDDDILFVHPDYEKLVTKMH